MKPKLTKKDITNRGKKVLRVRGNTLRNLLISHEPIGYNSGMYGWNWDAYDVYNIVICTGCRNLPGVVPYGARDYDAVAKKILLSTAPYDERAAKVEELLMRFCRANSGEGSE